MVKEQPINKSEALFVQLLLTFQTAAYHQMGKIASPLSGKVERNLQQAQNSIDILGMIQEKTQGNLSEAEQRMIDNILYELRMNFLEEQKKEKEAPEAEVKSKEQKQTQKGAAEPAEKPEAVEREKKDPTP
jgi:hypothetical protein